MYNLVFHKVIQHKKTIEIEIWITGWIEGCTAGHELETLRIDDHFTT